MFQDIRYNYENIITPDPNKWSREWKIFAGLPYIPVISEWEEKNFDYIDSNILWMQKNWHICIYIAIIYIVLIITLKKWIVKRKQYIFRVPFIVWNALMATFATLGVIRCLPQFRQIMTDKGLISSYCESDYYRDPRVVIWYWLFTLSKVPELVDTMFIILRGGKLIYLHWVHHALTLCFTFFVYGDIPATAQWMVNMNFFVHSVMYSYLTLKAVGLKISLFIRISITILQIIQMAFGIYIHCSIISRKLRAQPCDVSFSVAFAGLALYTIFLVLFTNYFIISYILNVKK